MRRTLFLMADGTCFAGMSCCLTAIGMSIERKTWQREAVARGVAGYDEQTGEWKWTVERKVAE